MRPTISSAVVEWLLDSDPAIRWQVRRDLLEEPASVVSAERARVATEGFGARLLRLQGDDGQWAGATWSHEWTCTFNVVPLLQILGLDPESSAARTAVERIKRHVTWGEEFDHHAFFAGEVEACINGRTLGAGAYFGEPNEPLMRRLLSEQLADGGWNCYAPKSSRSSFHSTINVLEGLLDYESAVGASPAISQAQARGREYLLERRMFRSLRTGQVVKAEWLKASFPNYWHYDVLRGLDYLRRVGGLPDPRATEALDLIERKREADGRWTLEQVHEGDVPLYVEAPLGQPSKWITLRALRVLKWAARV